MSRAGAERRPKVGSPPWRGTVRCLGCGRVQQNYRCSREGRWVEPCIHCGHEVAEYFWR